MAFASLVEEALKKVSPCHYVDPSVCGDCPTRNACAELAEIELERKHPYAIWKPQIYKALSGHPNPT